MKKLKNSLHSKMFLFSLAILFSFSLQSFRNVTGIQIEKRHYRKGYYVHVCREVKTEPIHQPLVSAKVKKGKNVAVQKQSSEGRSIPQNQIENIPQRNMAPSTARVSSN